MKGFHCCGSEGPDLVMDSYRSRLRQIFKVVTVFGSSSAASPNRRRLLCYIEIDIGFFLFFKYPKYLGCERDSDKVFWYLFLFLNKFDMVIFDW